MTEERTEYGTEAVAIMQRQVDPIVARAESLKITTTADYEAAANGLKLIKGQANKIDAELIEPWRQQKRHADSEMKRLKAMLLDPLMDAESVLKRKQITWRFEQERIRQAEEARLRAEAEARAEAERKRLEREAAKLKTPELREQRLEQAAAVQAAPITLAPSAPAIKGQSFRKAWKAKITDAAAAVKVIANWPDAVAYLDIKQGELDRFANRTKGNVDVSGVKFYEETTLASASK